MTIKLKQLRNHNYHLPISTLRFSRFQDLLYGARQQAFAARVSSVGQLSALRRAENTVVLLLAAFLQTCFWPCTDISFIDAASTSVCHNCPIESNRFFRDAAKRGKTNVG
jgi:hypothetical protein